MTLPLPLRRHEALEVEGLQIAMQILLPCSFVWELLGEQTPASGQPGSQEAKAGWPFCMYSNTDRGVCQRYNKECLSLSGTNLSHFVNHTPWWEDMLPYLPRQLLPSYAEVLLFSLLQHGTP